MRKTLFTISCVPLLALSISAQQVIVEIEQPQSAKSVAGVVVDPSGASLPGVTVEERSQDWKAVLRSTETDENGKFHFASSPNKSLYYLYFSRSGFNWLRIKLRVDGRAKPPLVIKMPNSVNLLNSHPPDHGLSARKIIEADATNRSSSSAIWVPGSDFLNHAHAACDRNPRNTIAL